MYITRVNVIPAFIERDTMCERFTLNIPQEVIGKIFDLPEVPQIEPRYNIAPGQAVAVVRQIADHNKLDFLKWGLLPEMSSDAIGASGTFSSETVRENSAFHSITANRCIIPASGFYKWLPMDNHEQPHYIRLLNSSMLGFAGLWGKLTDEDGTESDTCCIITTEANEIIKPINDRMPLILQPEDYHLWLDRNVQDPHELQRLYQPFPSDLMVAYLVPDLVNNLRFDSASCIVQV